MQPKRGGFGVLLEAIITVVTLLVIAAVILSPIVFAPWGGSNEVPQMPYDTLP